MDSNIKLYKGKYIDVAASQTIESVKKMLLEHWDKKEMDNTIFITWPIKTSAVDINNGLDYIQKNMYNPNPVADMPWEYVELNIIDLDKLKSKYKKIIWYDLEHSGLRDYAWIRDEWWMSNVDEIWTPWIENLSVYDIQYRNKAKFMPMRYYTIQSVSKMQNKKYDFGFWGKLIYDGDDYRAKLLMKLCDYQISAYYNNSMECRIPRIWCHFGVTLDEISNIVNDTKIMLDLDSWHHEYMNTQNVVRINEFLSRGIFACCDEPVFDYFPELHQTINHKMNLDEAAYFIINNVLIPHQPISIINDIWKRMSYKDIDYESYKQSCINRYIEKFGDIYNSANRILRNG